MPKRGEGITQREVNELVVLLIEDKPLPSLQELADQNGFSENEASRLRELAAGRARTIALNVLHEEATTGALTDGNGNPIAPIGHWNDSADKFTDASGNPVTVWAQQATESSSP